MIFTRFSSLLTRVSQIRNLNQSKTILNFSNLALRNSTVKPELITMKLESPEFKSLFTPELVKLSELFKKYDYEIRIAGGAVRDLLQGLVPHDIDFATTATPAQMKEMFEREEIRMINAKGERHGTITARINDKENFEVTTLRIDVLTDGRHAEVEFTKDWQLDASRRDLTVNSMFLGLDGTVFDYFKGKVDLDECKVRFVGDAETRIREDYLRILRYFRFFGRIAKDPDSHDQDTLGAIKTNLQGLENISGERLWTELKKIVVGRFAPNLVSVMLECGLGPYVGLPNITDAKNMFPIYERAKDLEPSPMTILSSILRNKSDVELLHKRLKLSNEELQIGLFVVEHRDEFQDSDDKMKFSRSKSVELVQKEPKVKLKVAELLKYNGKGDMLKDYEKWEMPKFPVNGKSLVLLGIKGPMLMKILTEMRLRWIGSEFSLTEQELLDKVDEIREQVQ